MHKGIKFGIAALFAATLLGGFFYSADDSAEARPQYVRAFAATFPDLKAATAKAKCGVCHPGKDKKERNDFGKAFGMGLSQKNEKDKDALEAALKKAAEKEEFKKKIEAGELPN